MKRIVCFVILAVLLLSGCSVTEQAPTISNKHYTYGIYELIFRTKLLSNDWVGNDWSFTYTYNGQPIKNGFRLPFSLELFTYLPIGVRIQENDKIDDVGTGTLYVALCDGGSDETEITVIESGGSHAGHAAVWEISCTVKLVDKQCKITYQNLRNTKFRRFLCPSFVYTPLLWRA